MIESRTQSGRSVVVVDVVVFVVVAVAESVTDLLTCSDRSGHGHVYDHDLLRLSRDCRALQPGGFR